MNTVIKEKKIGNAVIQLVKGDITEEKVDAIVNAANSHLRHGGGVAGAIVRKGGYIIQEESNKIGHVPVGHVAITTAGSLPAKAVIHAVGPMWGEGDEEKKLRSAIKNTLLEATKNKFKTISLPAISSGIFGYPKDENAKVILNEIHKFLTENQTTLEVIRICIIDDKTLSYFEKHFDSI